MRGQHALLALIAVTVGIAGCALMHGVGREAMPWVQVSGDGKGFVFAGTHEQFVPWGMNYDHDAAARLIEDYWISEWANIEGDFREMKALGANAVRIHLQFGQFMQDVDTPNEGALAQLVRLLRLAEQTRLYLDITGLGCYEKERTPSWYNNLAEEDRWAAQARFWEAIASTCASSPAVFCYDLMNEPVAPTEPVTDGDWLPGAGFGGRFFVQWISLDPGGRSAPQLARDWIRRLRMAICARDERHMMTVGLVSWSLDRPGLRSGFVPALMAPELDFICVHLYPEAGKLDEDMETLRAFSVGKPVVIEEMFPLTCGIADFRAFVAGSSEVACGWFGFYWGELPDETRPPEGVANAMLRDWLHFFAEGAPAADSILSR